MLHLYDHSPDVLIYVAGQILRVLHRRYHILLVVLVIQSIQDLLPHSQLLLPMRQFVSQARKILEIAINTFATSVTHVCGTDLSRETNVTYL